MGFNTTVVILNDGLEDIANDKDFGKHLAEAIQNCIFNKKVMLYSGHGNVGEVVETHHADYTVTVKVGHNEGVIVI